MDISGGGGLTEKYMYFALTGCTVASSIGAKIEGKICLRTLPQLKICCLCKVIVFVLFFSLCSYCCCSVPKFNDLSWRLQRL